MQAGSQAGRDRVTFSLLENSCWSNKVMSQITLYCSGRGGYYHGNIRFFWKYQHSLDIICILWKYPRSVDVICISRKYPRSIDIISILWIHLHSVYIIRILCKYSRSVDIREPMMQDAPNSFIALVKEAENAVTDSFKLKYLF